MKHREIGPEVATTRAVAKRTNKPPRRGAEYQDSRNEIERPGVTAISVQEHKMITDTHCRRGMCQDTCLFIHISNKNMSVYLYGPAVYRKMSSTARTGSFVDGIPWC